MTFVNTPPPKGGGFGCRVGEDVSILTPHSPERALPEDEPLTNITPTYTYSSVEIERFGREFSNLAQSAISVLTRLAGHEQAKIGRAGAAQSPKKSPPTETQ
jgi:hypothetical protein